MQVIISTCESSCFPAESGGTLFGLSEPQSRRAVSWTWTVNTWSAHVVALVDYRSSMYVLFPNRPFPLAKWSPSLLRSHAKIIFVACLYWLPQRRPPALLLLPTTS